MEDLMGKLVKLLFKCSVKCNPEYADELGESIAMDLLNEWSNGVDYLDWEYVDYELREEV